MAETTLESPPDDGITSVHFSRHRGAELLSSSWDGTLRLYDAVSGKAMQCSRVDESGLLACGFAGQGLVGVAGAVDGGVYAVELGGRGDVVRQVGSHEAGSGVKAVLFSEETQVVMSGGWDRTLKVWDLRAGGGAGQAPVVSAAQPGKVYTMDAMGERVVVGTSERHVNVYDVRRFDKPLQERESSLLHQTRVLRCSPDGQGYALGSIEGRVSIEYFDPSEEVQALKYAFKCHRTTVDGVQTLYPVNALAYHPVHGTFATGGGDGFVSVWDGKNKRRIRQFPQQPTSIAGLDFSADGQLLAMAVSYTFEQGEREHPKDAIVIRRLTDKDVRPRARKRKA